MMDLWKAKNLGYCDYIKKYNLYGRLEKTYEVKNLKLVLNNFSFSLITIVIKEKL